jgi:hypothetical protein
MGINTSAQIESAIVGRPVHTLLADEFRATQQGTLHFQYLQAEGFGHLHVAQTLEEHTALLERSLDDGASEERNARFLRRFVRPRGLEVAATPVVVDVLEELAAGHATRPDPAPALAPGVRFLLSSQRLPTGETSLEARSRRWRLAEGRAFRSWSDSGMGAAQ